MCTVSSSGESQLRGCQTLNHHPCLLCCSYVNKEKGTGTAWQPRGGAAGPQANKTRDVIYWFLDYREFADVVKYRIAMMRRAIDDKIKNEVGKRGYLCPNCQRQYDPLEIAHTFDPSTNAFLCEVCSTELVEDDPALHGDDTGGQDRMQRFNVATAPIRDALKSIEGARLPTINIVAWIAQNVTTEAIPDAAAASADGRKFDVVMGAEDDTAAREKLAEEQRAQNALPVWYTHSTITGDTTALGNKDAADKAKLLAAGGRVAGAKEGQDEDDALAAHYANMDDDDEEELEEADMGDGGAAATPTPVQTAEDTPVPAVMVMVAGVAKALAEVTDADEGVMTEEEYEAYFEAISASQQ